MQLIDGPFGLATVGNVLVIVFREPPTDARLERIVTGFSTLGAQFPTGIGFAWIIDPHANGLRPSDKVRDAMVAAMRRNENNVKAGFIAILREGLSGAAIRAVTNGIILASRQTTPVKVVGTIEEGVPWLVTKLRDLGAPPPLEATLRTVASSIRARLV